jgi:hypothetical protein
MYAPTSGQIPARPFLVRLLIRSREYRHTRFWAPTRIIIGIWDFCLGLVLLSFGIWWGLVPLAGAALLFWTANRLQHGVKS